MTLAGPVGFAKVTFRVEVYVDAQQGVGKAKTIANKVRSVLEGYRGTVEGVDILGVMPTDETAEAVVVGETFVGLMRVSLEFLVMHRE